MDIATINAIADKLGVAVQSAEDFINYILPQMASYYSFQSILVIIIAIVVNAIAISLAVIGHKKELDVLEIIGGTLALFTIIGGIVALVIGINNLVGWVNWPEVMLFNKIVG